MTIPKMFRVLTMALLVTPGDGDKFGPWLSRAFDYLLSSDAAVQQKARARAALEGTGSP